MTDQHQDDQATAYSFVARWMHWAMAVLICLALMFGFVMDDQSGTELASSLARHSSAGLLVLGFAILRVFWRLGYPPSRLPKTVSKLQALAAWTVHLALYGFMLGVPLTGIYAAAAHDLAVLSFWMFDLREGVQFLGVDNFETRRSVHTFAMDAFLVFLILHIGGALVHQFYFKDDVLRRMTGRKKAGQSTGNEVRQKF